MNIIEFNLNKDIYSKISILKAVHKYSADYTADIEEDRTTNSYIIKLKYNDGVSSIKLDKKMFVREVLDNELRLNLSAQTEAIRNLIIAQAFSNTNLISDGSKE